ncbi:site-specific integrase [Butyricimonas faecihominis]|jgi:integrase
MKSYKFTLYLRIDKQKKSGKMPLYIRFRRIDGEEPKFPLGMDLSKEEWDEKTMRPVDPALKLLLDKEVLRIEREIYNATINDIEITKILLKDIVRGKKIAKPENNSFYDYFVEYLSKKEKNGKLKDSTRKSYETTLSALKEFNGEVKVKDINAKLLENFDKFLIKRGKESGKGEVKGSRYNRIKHIKTIIRYIEDLQIPIENPYRSHDLVAPESEINNIFLDFDELKRMYKLISKVEEKSTERRVLLMYLFSSATGLRISDILTVEWGNLDVERDPMVLNIITRKQDKPLSVPIFPLAEEVLLFAPEDDLNNVERDKLIFHTYSRATINTTLRKLAKRVGIEKRISFHSARRTFATLAKMQGVSDFALKNYMGHSNYRMTERYTKWSPNLAESSAREYRLFEIKKLLKNDS